MLLMGDEIGRSQGGNNNSWCQNNSLGWMYWDENKQDLELLEFLKNLINLRKQLIKFINPTFTSNKKNIENFPSYYWHGTKLDKPDWSSWSHTIAFSINTKKTNPLVWAGLNAYSKNIDFCVPKLKGNWIKVIDTSIKTNFEPYIFKGKSININSRSSVLIISEEVFGAKNNIS